MKIGFLGGGKMGLPICWNIAKGLNCSIKLYDLHPPMFPPQLQGADERIHYSNELSDLADCSLVVLCLPDSSVVSSVIEGGVGRAGLIEILKPGSCILDCGSSIPAETLRLSQLLAAKNITIHDAPVSGGIARAWKGELTVMAGGISQDSPLCQVLKVFAKKIVCMDKVGDGHVMKAANNYLLAANIVSFSEALRFARTAGISFDKFGEVVNSSSGASYVSANKLETVRLDDDSVSFTTALIAKDVRNFIDSYHRLGLDFPLVPKVLDVWSDVIDAVGGDVDSMKIYRTLDAGASPSQLGE